MNDQLARSIDKASLRRFCQKWGVAELALFGSGVSNAFTAESDVDLLVRFSGQATWSLLDHQTMLEELRQAFGRKVDLVTRSALDSARNEQRRRAILDSAEVLDVS